MGNTFYNSNSIYYLHTSWDMYVVVLFVDHLIIIDNIYNNNLNSHILILLRILNLFSYFTYGFFYFFFLLSYINRRSRLWNNRYFRYTTQIVICSASVSHKASSSKISSRNIQIRQWKFYQKRYANRPIGYLSEILNMLQ